MDGVSTCGTRSVLIFIYTQTHAVSSRQKTQGFLSM